MVKKWFEIKGGKIAGIRIRNYQVDDLPGILFLMKAKENLPYQVQQVCG